MGMGGGGKTREVHKFIYEIDTTWKNCRDDKIAKILEHR